MTLTPYQLAKTTPYSMYPPKFLPFRLSTEEIGNPSMPMTSEILGERKGITRKECDEWAAMSHQRAARAQNEGLFREEIVPIPVKTKKGPVPMDQDECIRPETTLESLSSLPPIVKQKGLVTAGNSCPVSDGAGAVVVMSEEKALAMGIKPLLGIRSFATVGVDPNIMGYGPVSATQKALSRAGLSAKDIGVVELNEAFAAQVVPCVRDLGLDAEKVNPNGGAIALGHPLAGTGAILTAKILYEMRRMNHEFGLVTMCIGGGQGMAVIYEQYR